MEERNILNYFASIFSFYWFLVIRFDNAFKVLIKYTSLFSRARNKYDDGGFDIRSQL